MRREAEEPQQIMEQCCRFDDDDDHALADSGGFDQLNYKLSQAAPSKAFMLSAKDSLSGDSDEEEVEKFKRNPKRDLFR